MMDHVYVNGRVCFRFMHKHMSMDVFVYVIGLLKNIESWMLCKSAGLLTQLLYMFTYVLHN